MAIPDDEIDINLRSPEEISVRLVILAALTRRLLLEDASGEESADELFDLRHWFVDEHLDQHATVEELRIINTDVGHLTPDDRVVAEMSSESLVALAWSVSLVPALPPPDQPASVNDLLDRLPAPWDSLQQVHTDLALRPEETVATERERAELWLWRAMIEPERQNARGRERADLDALIRETASEAAQAGIIDDTRAGDFSLGNQPFRQLSPDHQDLVDTIAAARLHAFNWVCGFGASWGDVPLDIP